MQVTQEYPLWHLSIWPFMPKLCCILCTLVIHILSQLSLPPSFCLPLTLTTLNALCYCVTTLRESVCTMTPRPTVRERRGCRSLRRAQGSKHCVRSSGTPIWLCNPSTDKLLFLLKISFHSPQQQDSFAGGQGQDSGGGQWVTFWF